MSGHLRIFIEQRGHGARGPRFTVRLNRADGAVLIDGTNEPLHDAARLLLSKGITGRLQMWDGVRPYWRLQGDIERLAAVTVSEGQHGITLRKYAERTAGGDFDDKPSRDVPTEIDRPRSAPQASRAMEAA